MKISFYKMKNTKSIENIKVQYAATPYNPLMVHFTEYAIPQ